MVEGMTIMLEWIDGEKQVANTATEALEQLLHGWNPSTLPELRAVLAKRGRIAVPDNTETDEQFLQRLHDAGVLTMTQDN